MATEKQRLTFISYSRDNKDFALELGKELRASGFPIWLDQLDIPTGARWDDEIERALEQCEIFLVVLTPNSIASNNVKDEIGYAIDANKRIMPILLEHANIPFRLRRFQYVDFTDISYNEGIDAAKQLLRKLLDEPTEPRSEPVSTNVQSPQPKVDRSAEMRADANRLARQRAEAIQKAREREEMERRSQVVHPTPAIERKPPQPQTQRQSAPKLIPIFVGISLILLLCLGGGVLAWPYIFPPTTTIAPSVPTTPVPTTETPTITFTLTPTLTPSPVLPDPVQFVIDYWQYVSAGEYDEAWKYLTKDFREQWHKDDILDYEAGYEKRNYCKIETSNGRLLTQEGNNAVVSVQVTYYTGPCPGKSVPYDFTITLVYNEVDRIWQYDSATNVKK